MTQEQRNYTTKTTTINKKYFRQAVANCWADTAWFSGFICTWQLHAANPLRSATYISKHAAANQIVTLVLRHFSGLQPASQPAVIGRNDRPQVTAAKVCTHFWKNVIIFITTTPIDIKASTCPARVCVPNFAVVRPQYVWCPLSRKRQGIETWRQCSTYRKWLSGNQMFTWPMTSRDRERSVSWPAHYLENGHRLPSFQRIANR